jgi:hypothetical protein
MSEVKTGIAPTVIPLGRPYQYYTCFAVTRYWVFYSNGTNICFKSSTDGSTWSDETDTGKACVGNSDFSIFLEGTTIYYARTYTVASKYQNMYVRSGTLVSDGTITWADEAVALVNGDEVTLKEIGICRSTDGYIWIVYEQGYSTPNAIYGDHTDGTWGTTVGPVNYVSLGETTAGWSAIIPLTSNKVLGLGATTPSNQLFFNVGTVAGGWGSQVEVPVTLSYAANFGVVAIADVFYIQIYFWCFFINNDSI